jgi:hypothetical protein
MVHNAGGDSLFYGNCLMRRIVGFFLVLIGVVLLLCFMPFWMWLALLGVTLLILGCIVLIRGLN